MILMMMMMMFDDNLKMITNQAAESTKPGPACVEVTNALWLFSRHRAGEEWFTSKVMMMMMVTLMMMMVVVMMIMEGQIYEWAPSMDATLISPHN